MSEPVRKCLLVWWDPATNEVELDDNGSGLSCFDVAGVLSFALDIAAQQLPQYEPYPESEEE